MPVARMKDIADTEGWSAVAFKYGPGWVIAGYLVYQLSTGVSSDLAHVREDMAREHQALGYYLRAVCIGFNRDQPTICDPVGVNR